MFGVFCDQWLVAWTLERWALLENAARFRPRIEFLSRMSHRRPRATTMFALVVSLVFYSLITNGFAAPAETSPPPVTPTPEARPSPGNASSTAATPSKAVENSVVKIFATLRQPDPTKPWTKKSRTISPPVGS